MTTTRIGDVSTPPPLGLEDLEPVFDWIDDQLAELGHPQPQPDEEDDARYWLTVAGAAAMGQAVAIDAPLYAIAQWVPKAGRARGGFYEQLGAPPRSAP